MTTEEFNLSDKIEGNMFRYVDVKTFIAKLKEELWNYTLPFNEVNVIKEIDKLAGDKLT